MPTRRRTPRVVVTRDNRSRVPGPVAIYMALINLGMAAAVVFVLTRLDSAIAYIFGAPLVIAFLVTGTTYTWLFFRRRGATSQSPSSGSRGSRSP